jgi:carboxymethylenebutenolidase
MLLSKELTPMWGNRLRWLHLAGAREEAGACRPHLLEASQVKACVMYYGMPEMDVVKLKTLKCDVLGIFAEKDNFINVELVKAFEGKMKEAGKKIVVYNYVAEHAFANPSNPQYNEQAAKDAYENKVLPFLKNKMKIK